jgi:cupin fold WbuC family metalloprotein
MRTKPFNNEVLYPDEPIVRVDRRDMDMLTAGALANERKRKRLCAHQDVDDRLHEMLIIHTRDTYVRPHKHLNKSESFHVIAGRVDVVFFDENGRVDQVTQMGDYASGLCFYYRVQHPVYHTLLIQSDVLVFHEATNGPLDRRDTLFAPWAPDNDNTEAQSAFMSQLLLSIQTMR